MVQFYKAAAVKEQETLQMLDILETNNKTLYTLGVEVIDLVFDQQNSEEKINSMLSIEEGTIELKDRMINMEGKGILEEEELLNEAFKNLINGLDNILLAIEYYLDLNENNNDEVLHQLKQVVVHGDLLNDKTKQFKEQESYINENIIQAEMTDLNEKLNSTENLMVGKLTQIKDLVLS